MSRELLHSYFLISEETYELLAAVVLMLRPEPVFGAKSDILGMTTESYHKDRSESPRLKNRFTNQIAVACVFV